MREALLFPLWIGRHLRNRIAAGLILLIPVGITYFILRAIVNFLDDLIRPTTTTLAQWFPGSGWVDLVPAVGSTLAALILLYVTGLFARNLVGRWAVRVGENLVRRVPVLRAIYGTAREATNLLSGIETSQYSRVVLVSFPHPAAKSLGLVTGTFLAPSGRQYLLVYVPTTPTPMSGYLIFVQEDQVEDAGISVDSAMRMVVTAGIFGKDGVTVVGARSAAGGPREPGSP